MVSFLYTAKDKTGKTTKGTIENNDRVLALAELKKQELLVISIKEKGNLRGFSISHRISLFERMNFTKQLAVMVKAGLPIVESLELQASQTSNAYFKRVITNVKEAVRSGSTLNQAFKSHVPQFGEVYIAMVDAGEKGGQLDTVLDRIAEMLEKEYELKAKIKGAFYYPVFILVVLVLVTIFILMFVIPQLKTVFEDLGATLPFITQILLAISYLLTNYFPIVVIFIVVIIVAIRLAIRLPQVKRSLDVVKLKLPIFGKFTEKVYLERFARTLASLISAGIPILEVITTTTKVVDNSVYQRELDAMKAMVERGQPISEAMRLQRHFPPVVANLLAIGEKTGNLSEVAEDLAEFYSKEIDQTTKNLSSLLEPFIMLVMAGGIGLVVAAVVLPIYRLIGVSQ